MLSKSRILSAMQCPKRLWLEVNRPELRRVSADLERRFRQGRRLNEVVHGLYAAGRLIGPEVPLDEALALTRQQLERDPERPLFEATFSADQALVRADLFQQVDGAWRLTEVKSSTRPKPYHLADCAVQARVISDAGYPVERVMLAHVDIRFRYRGDGDYRGLLREVDLSEKVRALLPQVPQWIARGMDALAGSEPAIGVGPHCSDPFPCPFLSYCGPEPPEYPLSLLPGGGRIIQELLAEGIADVREIPHGRLAKPLQIRVHQATVSGRPYLAAELSRRLRALPYPRYYLDFESIQFAVPVWAGTHPYEQLPFQWSCQVEQSATALHEEAFLDTSGAAPMRGCAERLLAALGDVGPILTYSPFERTVIRRLAARFPDLADPLVALTARIVDLLPLVKADYYHPAMKGSFSIKAVLPTVAPHLSYATLDEVSDGTSAQAAFEEAIDPATTHERRLQLERALLDYCALDTLAMVELVRRLSDPDETSRALC
jgi:hypothetical protein